MPAGILPVVLLANPSKKGSAVAAKKKPAKKKPAAKKPPKKANHRSVKQMKATEKMIAANRAARAGKPKKKPAVKKNASGRKEKPVAQKKARTAAQKAATARMIAANKAKHAGKAPPKKHNPSKTHHAAAEPAKKPKRRKKRNGPGGHLSTFLQVAGATLLAGGASAALEYGGAGTEMLASPTRRGIVQGVVALAAAAGAVAAPSAAPALATTSAMFAGPGIVNATKAVMSGSAAKPGTAPAPGNAIVRRANAIVPKQLNEPQHMSMGDLRAVVRKRAS